VNYLLKLQSKTGKQNVDLLLKEIQTFNMEDVFVGQSATGVCADTVYSSAILVCQNIDEIESVELFLNDMLLGKVVNPSEEITLEFKSSEIFNGLIFRDCYGFVQLNVAISFVNGDSKNLYSDYIAVFFKDTVENQSLQKMAEYVYQHYEKFLYDDKQKPAYDLSIKEAEYKSIEVYIRLIKNLINAYDASYSFLRVNAKNKIIESGKIDNFEKLSYIKSSTLAFISQHPEELIPININGGVKIGNRFYRPIKTLVSNNVFTYDLYENRIIVGFLKFLNTEIIRILAKIDIIFSKYSSVQSMTFPGYISSVQYIFQGTIRRLEKNKEELLFLKDNVVRLYYAYYNIFNIDVEEINQIPEPTAIFMAIPQYNIIFNSIVQWFRFGAYNLEKEECLLPFLINNQLYEYYALLKILNGLCQASPDVKLIQSKRFSYKMSSKSLYKNTVYNNTFIFETQNKRISIFYQPVVFGQGYSVYSNDNNTIELYRNTTFKFPSDYLDAEDRGGKRLYYTPDYIIKIETNSRNEYLILDAKYSDVTTVKNHYFAALVFKYIFSISTVKSSDSILGLYALCGKQSKQESVVNVYDITNQLGFDNNNPDACIVPLFESETCVGFQQIIKNLKL